MNKDRLADELSKDSQLAWELFASSQDAGDDDMAAEYERLARDAESRLARFQAAERSVRVA